MKKITALILLAFILSAYTSCGDKPAAADSTEAATASETSVTSETKVSDNLADYNFNGETFNMYTRYTQLFSPSLSSAEMNGDLLNDAIYERNRGIEERFNCKLSETAYYNTSEGNDAPRKLLASGDDTYDLITGRYLNMFNYAAEEYLISTTELPNIDVTKSYWNSEMYRNLSVCGKHFFAVGAFNISAYDFTHVMLFNKQMAEDYSLGDIYKLVTDGKWTFDEFNVMSQKVVNDLNGDDTMDDKDQYGYTSRPSAVMPGFWVGADVQPVTKDSGDALEFSALGNEKFFNVCKKVFDMTRNNGAWYVSLDGSDGDNQPSELFRDGNALFMDAKLYEVTKLRDSDVEFGIIPYPKYTEKQENYLARMEGCELFGIPLSNSKLEMTGAILEAMACESQESIVPVYYDTMLKYKVSRDEESAKMLDLIFEHLVFDYADTLLGTEFRDGTMNKCFNTNQQDLTSALTGSATVYQSALDKYNEAFSKLLN